MISDIHCAEYLKLSSGGLRDYDCGVRAKKSACFRHYPDLRPWQPIYKESWPNFLLLLLFMSPFHLVQENPKSLSKLKSEFSFIIKKCPFCGNRPIMMITTLTSQPIEKLRRLLSTLFLLALSISGYDIRN